MRVVSPRFVFCAGVWGSFYVATGATGDWLIRSAPRCEFSSSLAPLWVSVGLRRARPGPYVVGDVDRIAFSAKDAPD